MEFDTTEMALPESPEVLDKVNAPDSYLTEDKLCENLTNEFAVTNKNLLKSISKIKMCFLWSVESTEPQKPMQQTNLRE